MRDRRGHREEHVRVGDVHVRGSAQGVGRRGAALAEAYGWAEVGWAEACAWEEGAKKKKK